MGTLYIVATPIGNLKDITLRAIEILNKVEIIACEDTRHTGLLLKYIRENCIIRHSGKPRLAGRIQNLSTTYEKKSALGDSGQARMTNLRSTLLSYHETNEHKRIPQILNVLKNGLDVALVSDAGTPTISDPGFKLVRECIKEDIKVESIPGPSSVISSLVVSGLPTDKFLFLGYLPKKSGKRKRLLNELSLSFKKSKLIHPTIIFFEAPHRLIQSLNELKEVFGDINIVVCRELTKLHEEVRREKISQSSEHFKKTVPRGELTILFHF